jgi:adenylate cyclase
VGIVGIIAGLLPLGLSLDENVGLDFLFKMRGEREAPSDVVVVSIDKDSSENLNLPDNPDKWPRSIHAQLVEKLVKEGAKVITFDVHFLERRSLEGDNLFAQAIREARNCVLCEPLKAKEIPLSGKGNPLADSHSIVKIVKPLDLFADPAAATAPFVLPRIPFKVNQYWTFQTGAGDSPTIPAVVFQLYTLQIYEDFTRLLEKASPGHAGKLPPDKETVMKRKQITGLVRDIREIFESDPLIAERMLGALESLKTFSTDANKRQMIKSLIRMYQGPSRRYINYYGPPRTITTLPYYQAIQLRNGSIGDKKIELKDKAVFVGFSEIMLADRKDSFYTVFSEANGIFIAGVEIAATAFANLLEERPLKHLPLYLFILIILFWGMLAGIFCRMFRVLISAVGCVALGVVYFLMAVQQFKIDVWLPTVVPLLLQLPLAFFAGLVWNYVDVNKERQNIKKALGYHLPKEVVNQIAKDIVHIETEAQVVYGICLFTDVAQYTNLCETMDPAELGRLMNRYYETIFKPVQQQKGYVSGVIGDAMLAVWATTSSEAALRENACSAAIDIKKVLMAFNQSSDIPPLKTRIGVHCGQILLGHIGALDHYEYTPMGDIVNTASRIEGLNKHLKTGILVSDEIIHQLTGFLAREMGKFKVAGKVKPVVVYELMGRVEECDDGQRQINLLFSDALNTFKRKSWDEALKKFHQILEKFGEDGPSQFYIRLCEDYEKNPPAEPWDGVVRAEKK